MASQSPYVPPHRTWSREDPSLVVSTDPALIPLEQLNEALASDMLHWAKPVHDLAALRFMLDRSLCLGMYTKASLDEGKPNLIGFARAVTDFTTTYYITDIYVLPAYQGNGVGRWIVGCMKEMYDVNPHMRYAWLITGSEQNFEWYKRQLGLDNMEGKFFMGCVYGPGH